MDHGLFGKLSPGPIIEFADWRDVARLVYANSKKHITMYRSVISFDEETAAELNLINQKAWQRYIENHIMTIAEKNNIRREHLQWACALHKEKHHPHIHVVFWDTSSRVKNPFTLAVPAFAATQEVKVGNLTYLFGKHWGGSSVGAINCPHGEGYGAMPLDYSKGTSPSPIPEQIEGYPVICLTILWRLEALRLTAPNRWKPTTSTSKSTRRRYSKTAE